jgi:hypothetical protein
MEEAGESGDSVKARTADPGAVANKRGKEAMPGSQPFGFDHRFAIEDLLDEYLEAFQPDSRLTAATDPQDAGIEAGAVMTAGQHDDGCRAASATG